jgi:hypothetical protein
MGNFHLPLIPRKEACLRARSHWRQHLRRALARKRTGFARIVTHRIERLRLNLAAIALRAGVLIASSSNLVIERRSREKSALRDVTTPTRFISSDLTEVIILESQLMI